MNFWQRIFSSRPAKNELITLKENYARQQQLIANSQQHVSFLLERIKVLENVVINLKQTPSQPLANRPVKPTVLELQILELVKAKGEISSHDIFEAMKYKNRQTATQRACEMVKRGLLIRVGSGKLSRYILPEAV